MSSTSLNDILKKLNAADPKLAVWITDNESREVTLKYPEGTLVYTIKTVKYSDGNRGTTLNLRLTRASDQKAYVGSYGHARFEQHWGVNTTAETIRSCFERPHLIMPLDVNCVILLRHGSSASSFANDIRVILNEEVNSRSEEAKTIDRLTKENVALKTAHTAEMEAVRAEIAKLRAEAAAWNEMQRPTKKSKPAAEDIDVAPPPFDSQ